MCSAAPLQGLPKIYLVRKGAVEMIPTMPTLTTATPRRNSWAAIRNRSTYTPSHNGWCHSSTSFTPPCVAVFHRLPSTKLCRYGQYMLPPTHATAPPLLNLRDTHVTCFRLSILLSFSTPYIVIALILTPPCSATPPAPLGTLSLPQRLGAGAALVHSYERGNGTVRVKNMYH